MNDDEYPGDSALTRHLRGSLSELTVPGRPPLAAITSRGRAHQRRRLAGFAGLGVTGAATTAAAAFALAGVLGTSTIPSGASGAPATRSTGTIQTAAFTLTSNANGTDTLTLTRSQMLDPAALQQALTQHGIPALVKTGTYCWSSPAAPNPTSIGVLSSKPQLKPAQAPEPVPSGQQAGQIVDNLATVINPKAMPSGTELFFGYFSNDHTLSFNLIYTHSYSCSNG